MDVHKMMQQAKAMQDSMKEMQERLALVEVTGESGGGLVKLTLTCKGEVRSLDISPEVINSEDKEALEDLVVAAFNAARIKAEEKMSEETQKMMEEFGLPGNVELPGM